MASNVSNENGSEAMQVPRILVNLVALDENVLIFIPKS